MVKLPEGDPVEDGVGEREWVMEGEREDMVVRVLRGVKSEAVGEGVWEVEGQGLVVRLPVRVGELEVEVVGVAVGETQGQGVAVKDKVTEVVGLCVRVGEVVTVEQRVEDCEGD